MKHILFLVLALLTIVLIFNVLSDGVVPDGAAVATQVDGTVRIFTVESPAGRLLRKNDTIAKNDRVEAQEHSRLELRLPDGGWLRLSENARLTMQLLQFEKRSGTLYVQALLHKGKLWAKINKRTAPDSWVEIITGNGSATAEDTVYSVNAEDDASTAINVYQGALQAAGAVKEAPRTTGPTSAHAEIRPVGVKSLQQISVSAQGISQPRDFDPKATINDWIRWNLQQDTRENLVSITVTPLSPTITRGASLQFGGIAHYPDKTEKDITWFATWQSSDANIAKMDHSGIAAGRELGTATISAAITDMSGTAVLNVSRDLLSITVTPASQAIANGAVQQFTAIGKFSDKSVKDITSSAAWRSSNPNIAFVDATGRTVAGNTAGTAVISASMGTKRGSATLKVRRELVSLTIMPESATIAVHELQRFGAIGSYSDKTTEDLTDTAQWETSDAGIAEIDQAQAGRVLGKNKAGTAMLRATFSGKSGTATITVNKPPAP